MRCDALKFSKDFKGSSQKDINLWDIFFILIDTLIVFDNISYKIKVIVNAYIQAGDNLEKIYKHSLLKIDKLIKRLKVKTIPFRFRHIHHLVSPSGTISNSPVEDISQLVLSKRIKLSLDGDYFNIYRVLRTVVHGQYIFYMKFNDFTLIGSSPKILSVVDNPFDTLTACFSAGTPTSLARDMSYGDSKKEIEPFKKDPYGNCVGYIGFSGNMNMAMTPGMLIIMN